MTKRSTFFRLGENTYVAASTSRDLKPKFAMATAIASSKLFDPAVLAWKHEKIVPAPSFEMKAYTHESLHNNFVVTPYKVSVPSPGYHVQSKESGCPHDAEIKDEWNKYAEDWAYVMHNLIALNSQ